VIRPPWYLKLDKAAGYIYLAVDENQKIHFAMISDDPVKMWAALAAVHLQKCPGARFNAYDDLFSIRKQEDETLQSLMNRVDTASNHIQDVRPKDFTLSSLDDELASMTHIRALPDKFSMFASSLLLLDKLEKSTIHQAFVTEESQRRHRASAAPNVSSALAAASLSSAASSTPECSFCGMKWRCCKYLKSQDAQEAVRSNRSKPKGQKAKQAEQQTMPEFAGNASALSTCDSTTLQSDTDFHWLADTGATSHMTPHRAWMCNYTPHIIPIKLADHTIIYSAGMGSVVIHPVIKGQEARPVEPTRVLHVPQLRNNLLACLYLTKRKGIRLEVDDSTMFFKRDRMTLCTATANAQNCGILDVSTEPILEYVNVASTLPMEINLWHCHCLHHSHATIRK
jgi:hypothetical protein